MTSQPSLIIAVEDELSGAVMEKLLLVTGRSFNARVFNARGFGKLKHGMAKFREASRSLPHILLTDLDRYSCPPALLESWGATDLPETFLFRIAVREVEAWLMADRVGIAEFLYVDLQKVPYAPETEEDPKRTLINLARRSRRKRLSREIIPAIGSAVPIGPLYNLHMMTFVNSRWDVGRARQTAPSLDRALLRLSSFLAG